MSSLIAGDNLEAFFTSGRRGNAFCCAGPDTLLQSFYFLFCLTSRLPKQLSSVRQDHQVPVGAILAGLPYWKEMKTNAL
jgi:hypothetical protein